MNSVEIEQLKDKTLYVGPCFDFFGMLCGLGYFLFLVLLNRSLMRC
jgi:hypothetical protein